MRSETLKDVHILFSSVIPLDTKPESTEIWRVAYMFGAKCYTELSSQITHVVAAKVSRFDTSYARCSRIGIQHGTIKVDAARKRGGTKIVWLSWFTDSIALWHRQDETPYLLDGPSLNTSQPSSSGPTVDSQHVPSDPDLDADDWDEEPATIGKSTGRAEFDLGEIDWNDVNDEVDAAMNESDDDDDSRSERSGMRSANPSDDESGTDGTHSGIRCDLIRIFTLLINIAKFFPVPQV
jgi:RNA polymerase II subunit A-like phosphatase